MSLQDFERRLAESEARQLACIRTGKRFDPDGDTAPAAKPVVTPPQAAKPTAPAPEFARFFGNAKEDELRKREKFFGSKAGHLVEDEATRQRLFGTKGGTPTPLPPKPATAATKPSADVVAQFFGRIAD